ncbi:MAG: hypothetical protein IJS43_01170 [Bacteroidaceae bacterium]|nr:hypothetical protein [Bacteroidaceae bacterium]
MKHVKQLILLSALLLAALPAKTQVNNPILQKVEIPTDTIIDIPQVPPVPGNNPSATDVQKKKVLPDSLITFQDDGIKRFCVRNKHIDTNRDGEISVREAMQAEGLSLMSLKSFICIITRYDDLKHFPNLEWLHAGSTKADTLDVSGNKALKMLDLSDCRALSTVIVAKGCHPEIIMPRNLYDGKEPEVIVKE